MFGETFLKDKPDKVKKKSNYSLYLHRVLINLNKQSERLWTVVSNYKATLQVFFKEFSYTKTKNKNR